MTTFQNSVISTLSAFSAFHADTVNYIDGRVWVWLSRSASDYRKARAAIRKLAFKPGIERDLMVYSPEGKFEVWVHITT
jgi:hypothetical protein